MAIPPVPKTRRMAIQLRKLSADAIYDAIAKVPAHSNLQSVSDEDKRLIAYYIGGRKVGVADLADAKRMPNQCATPKPIDAAAPSWNGWGVDKTIPASSRPKLQDLLQIRSLNSN